MFVILLAKISTKPDPETGEQKKEQSAAPEIEKKEETEAEEPVSSMERILMLMTENITHDTYKSTEEVKVRN